jgi:NAD(P)-dependent dehydrogenase (short-subunit alcohol dehydrogenase family)
MTATAKSTVVITGASAGIGRATALAFARRGWNVALIARSQSGLKAACREIEAAGGAAYAIAADVADPGAIFAAADQILARWGHVEVWVNNAMASVFAPVAEITPEEFRRVTDVTYLGYVFGTMAALRCMRAGDKGTIVQVGSALSYRAIPLQAAYCGAKFAIRGFTDSLRSELRHERSAIRLTMVQLPAVNTPQFDWSRNKMARRPQPLGTIYQPEAVAETIFRASRDAPRELWVGFSAVKAIIGTMIAPGLLDRILASKAYDGQMSAEPQAAGATDNLLRPVNGQHAVHGRFDRKARRWAPAFSQAAVGAFALGSALLLALALILA